MTEHTQKILAIASSIVAITAGVWVIADKIKEHKQQKQQKSIL